jgi:hypothetical protein
MHHATEKIIPVFNEDTTKNQSHITDMYCKYHVTAEYWQTLHRLSSRFGCLSFYAKTRSVPDYQDLDKK